jgi:hypothetical protein
MASASALPFRALAAAAPLGMAESFVVVVAGRGEFGSVGGWGMGGFTRGVN